MRKRHWLRGDCHLHTTNSDGILKPEELYEALYEKSLDFAFITDHNFNTVGRKEFNYKGVGIFPGMEITGSLGHVNVFGEDLLIKSIVCPETEDEYFSLLDFASSRGAMISVNHPDDRRFGWAPGFEKFLPDSLELWNSPMHSDNVYCMNSWHKMLMNGVFVPAIGGSDYHRDFVVTKLLASPTTYVYSYSNTMDDIREAIKSGHVFVTNSPKAARIFLTCGDKVPGDTADLALDRQVNVSCDFLRRGQTLHVLNNDTEIFSHKAEKREDNVSFDIAVESRGFVRAYVGYELPAAAEKAYAAVASKLHQHSEGEEIPEFIYSFTNPIFFE